jgi:hypothetical protein
MSNQVNPDYNDSNDSNPQKSSGIFDFGFTRFITTTWISIIWKIVVFVIIAAYCMMLLAGLGTMTRSFPQGLSMIIMATIAAPLYLLFARIGLELVIIVFRIETHLRAIRDK